MVSSIIPGTTGAGALGVDPRYTRAANTLAQQTPANEGRSDSVQIGDAALWAAARQSVSNGLSQLGDALSAGRDVYGLLNQISSLAQSGDTSPDAQSQLSDLLGQLKSRVDTAVSQGASVLTGASLSVQAEPGAPDVVVQGIDLRLKDDPGAGDAIAIPAGANLDNPQALAQAAQKSMDALQSGMERLLDAARALDAHQGFLGAAAGAMSGVNTDMDADAARLTALQVRQGLISSSGNIANADPSAVLSLFRS
jgi:hypothetical protein